MSNRREKENCNGRKTTRGKNWRLGKQSERKEWAVQRSVIRLNEAVRLLKLYHRLNVPFTTTPWWNKKQSEKRGRVTLVKCRHMSSQVST